MSISALAKQDDFEPGATYPPDRRHDERHHATYRPCCVIAAKKVSMGLIRNYSVGGARIETDADLKVGDRINYFWEANTCIKARVVWREGRAVGVEHTDAIRKERKVYPMRSVRVPCEAEALCWVNGEIHTALVENISIGGMRLRGLPEIEPGTLMTVTFCDLEFPAVSVRWSKDQRTGVRFANRMTREMLAGLLMDERFGLSSIQFEEEDSK